ncbi:MAG: SEC-C metal-binding domain-containing protein [Eubacteriales bacterium]|nr:SEC-C metal-binding domain-containing protein [Eubacteriales bacterium]
MSYYSVWSQKSEDISDPKQYEKYIQKYYVLEREAYRYLLNDYAGDRKQSEEKSAREWATTLGFDSDMDIFVGFLEGMQSSSNVEYPLEDVVDETPVHFDLDYEKLLYSMHEAKANWLFGLDEWKLVLDPERHQEIVKQFRRDHIAVSNKVGRNEPCPCGSGKKYKACCGKNA